MFSARAFARIIGRCRLTAPMLKRPTKTGTSFSSAGSIPPRSYHGLKKARHPIGLITFLYFLYMLEIYPWPLMDSQSGYMVFAEQATPVSKTSSHSFPSPWISSSYRNTIFGNSTGFLCPAFPCPPIWTFSRDFEIIFSNLPVPSPSVTVTNG